LPSPWSVLCKLVSSPLKKRLSVTSCQWMNI
jgi:hypothetical protein